LCFIDKTPFTDNDYAALESVVSYNEKIKNAIQALEEKLPTFAVMDKGIKAAEKLCLLIERGSFWGMGYLPSSMKVTSTAELKDLLVPYADNDTIRNSIYSFVEQHPDKRISLSANSLVIHN
jgi:DNA polymerase-3 subunit epsilon